MSFLKFKQNGDGPRPVHWSRAERDGAPFRGRSVPLLREEEYEEFAERVHDCRFGTFRVTDREQRIHGRTYIEVLEGITNGWWRLLSPRQYQWWTPPGSEAPEMLVYIEWSEPYMELDERRLHNIQGGMAGGSSAP